MRKNAGLIINVQKTEISVFGKERPCDTIRLGTHVIKNVDQYLYLGSLMTWNNAVSKQANWKNSRCS